jgi:hypothetical protein
MTEITPYFVINIPFNIFIAFKLFNTYTLRPRDYLLKNSPLVGESPQAI